MRISLRHIVMTKSPCWFAWLAYLAVMVPSITVWSPLYADTTSEQTTSSLLKVSSATTTPHISSLVANHLSIHFDEAWFTSSLSFDHVRSDNDLTSEILSTATTFSSGYLRRGTMDGYLGLKLKGHADISLEPRNQPFALEIEQAYLGTMISQLKVHTGFMRSSVYNSKIWGYQKALPSAGFSLANQGYEAQMLYSYLPYKKSNRPVLSEELPYTLTLAIKKQFSKDIWKLLDSVSVIYTIAEDTPTELANNYLKQGNTVMKGQYSSQMAYNFSTMGVSWVFDGNLTASDRITSHWEVMKNTMAPESRGLGLWGDLVYTRNLSKQEACFLGYQAYSIGSDAILAEFSHKILGYTGVDGHGPIAGCKKGTLQVAASLWFIEPREASIYKRKTKALMISLSNKLFSSNMHKDPSVASRGRN